MYKVQGHLVIILKGAEFQILLGMEQSLVCRTHYANIWWLNAWQQSLGNLLPQWGQRSYRSEVNVPLEDYVQFTSLSSSFKSVIRWSLFIALLRTHGTFFVLLLWKLSYFSLDFIHLIQDKYPVALIFSEISCSLLNYLPSYTELSSRIRI